MTDFSKIHYSPIPNLPATGSASVPKSQKPKGVQAIHALNILGSIWIIVGVGATAILCLYTTGDSYYDEQTHPFVALGIGCGFFMISFSILFFSLATFMEATLSKLVPNFAENFVRNLGDLTLDESKLENDGEPRNDGTW